jgi:hypothetical protein
VSTLSSSGPTVPKASDAPAVFAAPFRAIPRS